MAEARGSSASVTGGVSLDRPTPAATVLFGIPSKPKPVALCDRASELAIAESAADSEPISTAVGPAGPAAPCDGSEGSPPDEPPKSGVSEPPGGERPPAQGLSVSSKGIKVFCFSKMSKVCLKSV